jgi:hypothetical protein
MEAFDVVGQVIAGKVAHILIREKTDAKIKLGNLLVAEGRDGSTLLLQVHNLSYGSQLDQDLLELTAGLELEGRGVTILLDAVVSMGLLEKKEEEYRCLGEVASIMSKESPTSITPMVMVATGGWKRWSYLTDIVRRGNRIRGTAFDINESEREAFTGAMHDTAYEIAPSIVAAINPSRARKLLDIGGGSGA